MPQETWLPSWGVLGSSALLSSLPSKFKGDFMKELCEAPREPAEASPARSVLRIRKLLEEARDEDIRRFGVETHARAPGYAYQYPPGAYKLREEDTPVRKPGARDYLAAPPLTPHGFAPRWGHGPFKKEGSQTRSRYTACPRVLAASMPRTSAPQKKLEPALEELWAAACREGQAKTRGKQRPPTKPLLNMNAVASSLPDRASQALTRQAERVEELQSREALSSRASSSVGEPWESLPLEPFEALSEDEFLRGPGQPLLTAAEKHHLRYFGLDFKERKSFTRRRHWGPQERERWQRSKRLRHLIKTQQVVFRRDLLQQTFEDDYLRYTGKPYRASSASRRFLPASFHQPFCGCGCAALERSPFAPETPQGQEGSSSGIEFTGGSPAGIVSHREPNGVASQLEGASRIAKDPVLAASLAVKQWLPTVAGLGGKPLRREHASEASSQGQMVEARADALAELVRLYEAAHGNLPSLFAGPRRIERKKHPKDTKVSFGRLKEYGAIVVEITSCKTLKQEVDESLYRGWSERPREQIRHMAPPKGVRTNPNYNVTLEKLQAAAIKLHADIIPDSQKFQALERRKRAQVEEPARILGGGRYAV
ncbi:uncharacterized protein LOC34624019 [Cyclospora cayetanensis]|uniref:Uncharacterized protein LOC34624019 n=1 Tax=Cyclospora cayetanensis TaxID=88456 RepID=A0A6P6RQ33_9EIME|nr:uncharacterized protein LOC34624019 [Cyclospora cayetanensis]